MISALIAMVFAFLLDIFLGDPPNRFHPVVAMGSLIRWTTVHLNHGNPAHRFILGMLSILSGAILFSIPWIFISKWISLLPFWTIGLLTGFLLKPVFAFRSLLKAGAEVQQALKENNLNEARRLVSWHLVSRDTSSLNESQVASATIESLAENLTDSFFAPLFYFAIGGLPLAWFYRYINTGDAMIGYRSKEFEFFGKFTARLDDVLNWLPARISAVLIVLSAAVCRLDFTNAFSTMKKLHQQTESPNAGWTMAAAAGALQVILEKQNTYRLAGGKKYPTLQTIQLAIQLIQMALFLSLLFCGGILILYERCF
jgi:adenosylcobinamide-phosphate synthase